MSFLQKLMDGTTQIGIRAVFALIILLVALAEGVGAEYILGAFLAGVVVSLLNPDEEMVEKLDSFGYGFFIPIFFIMVGVDLNIPSLIKEPSILLIIPVLILAFIVSKLIPVFFIKRWFDTKRRLLRHFINFYTFISYCSSKNCRATQNNFSGNVRHFNFKCCHYMRFCADYFQKMFPIRMKLIVA